MSLGSATVVRGDARRLALADGSVDLVVTSPPYFGLRSYQDGGEHYAGQVGAESTPGEFVASLIEVTRECVRVLKPSGSLWVNLGDKYAGAGGGGGGSSDGTTGRGPRPARFDVGISTKSLMGIPWRYALACIDDLGLILRAEVIWAKPNGLPESVTDRVRRSHEQWFHFTLEPRYFSAVDELREPHLNPSDMRHGRRNITPDGLPKSGNTTTCNPLGRLPGSVWSVPTEPLRVPESLGVDHFAAFPPSIVKRIVTGWSPLRVCGKCGEGLRPQAERGAEYEAYFNTRSHTTSYVCDCTAWLDPSGWGESTSPGVVLDPFGGTGTTAMVAKALGRHGVTNDMSADYCRLAEWRVNDRNQLAKVLEVAKAPPPDSEQLDLFAP